jgi:hypothetical protein
MAARVRVWGPLAPSLLLSWLALAAVAPRNARAGRAESEEVRADQYVERYGKEWPFDTPYNFRDPRELAQEEANIMRIANGQDRWDSWMRFSQELMTPNMTRHGVQVEEIPRDLSKRLYAFLHEHLKEAISEGDEDDKSSAITSSKKYPSMIYLPTAFQNEIVAVMQPIHERWCNCKLKFNALYGVRVYFDGSVLSCHLDRTTTHVVSSIMHIGHDLEEPWPIQIKDHFGRFLGVNLEPGEMLHYESARLVHCRMTEMKGNWYANAFIHFAPVDWNESEEDTEAAVPPYWQDGTGRPMQAVGTEMRNGTQFGTPEREAMVVEVVRRQRDARGAPRDPLMDPTREADELAASLRSEAQRLRAGTGKPKRAATDGIATGAAASVRRRRSLHELRRDWRGWLGNALIATGLLVLCVAMAVRGAGAFFGGSYGPYASRARADNSHAHDV